MPSRQGSIDPPETSNQAPGDVPRLGRWTFDRESTGSSPRLTSVEPTQGPREKRGCDGRSPPKEISPALLCDHRVLTLSWEGHESRHHSGSHSPHDNRGLVSVWGRRGGTIAEATVLLLVAVAGVGKAVGWFADFEPGVHTDMTPCPDIAIVGFRGSGDRQDADLGLSYSLPPSVTLLSPPEPSTTCATTGPTSHTHGLCISGDQAPTATSPAGCSATTGERVTPDGV